MGNKIKKPGENDKVLTHLNSQHQVSMVDVGDKAVSKRVATATGIITLAEETINLIKENKIKKGSVLTTARIAGINAAKSTSAAIPLCHNIIIDKVDIDLQIENGNIRAICTVKCTGKTGVEMEALHAVSVALLTIYDMCKAVDKNMVISGITLVSKEKTLLK